MNVIVFALRRAKSRKMITVNDFNVKIRIIFKTCPIDRDTNGKSMKGRRAVIKNDAHILHRSQYSVTTNFHKIERPEVVIVSGIDPKYRSLFINHFAEVCPKGQVPRGKLGTVFAIPIPADAEILESDDDYLACPSKLVQIVHIGRDGKFPFEKGAENYEKQQSIIEGGWSVF